MNRWMGDSGLELGKRLTATVALLRAREGAWWAAAALIWLGLVLRARGMWVGRTISLWEDEAAWAMWLVDRPLQDHVLRAIGFMAVSKWLVSVFSESEHVLRFLPWCGGVGAVLISPFLAKQLFRNQAARLLFIATIALHPGAIDLSKEFKPYALALLLHLLLLLFVLRYRAEQKQSDLLATVAIAFFGVLFSQDVVFCYPMVFGLLALVAFRNRNWGHFAQVAGSAACALGVMLALRANVAAKIGNPNDNITYWGGKYSVFYVPTPDGSRLGWTLTHLADLASLPGSRRELWQWSQVASETLARLRHLDSWLWILGSALGITVLLRQKRLFELTMLLVPLVTMMGFNYFGYWPFGEFRTNLFVLAYAGAFVALACDGLKESQSFTWHALPTVALVVVPFLTIGRFPHTSKTTFAADGRVREAAQALVQMQGNGQGEMLVVDNPNCAPWRYYARYHPGVPHAPGLDRRFNHRCAKSRPSMLRLIRDGVTRPGARAYILTSSEDEMKFWRDKLPSDLHVTKRQVIGNNDAMVLCVTKASRRR